VNEQGHYRSFRRRDFAISHLSALVLTNQNNQEKEHVQNTSQCNPQNGPNKQPYETLKKPRLRERTDWFSRLLRHLVRKRCRSILTTRIPHGATKHRQLNNLLTLYSRHWNRQRVVTGKKTKTQLLTKNHVTVSQILIIQYFLFTN